MGTEFSLSFPNTAAYNEGTVATMNGDAKRSLQPIFQIPLTALIIEHIFE